MGKFFSSWIILLNQEPMIEFWNTDHWILQKFGFFLQLFFRSQRVYKWVLLLNKPLNLWFQSTSKAAAEQTWYTKSTPWEIIPPNYCKGYLLIDPQGKILYCNIRYYKRRLLLFETRFILFICVIHKVDQLLKLILYITTKNVILNMGQNSFVILISPVYHLTTQWWRKKYFTGSLSW